MLSHPLAAGAELRALEPWRAREFHEFVERSGVHLAPWLPWATAIDDVPKAEAWLRGYAEDQIRDGRRLYGIWLDGLLVGGAGFATFDARNGTCSLGAWLAPEARGRGLVTLAARHLIDWAVHTRGLSRVEWSAATANTSSLAVARRLGMRREGVLRSALDLDGVRHDVEVWSLVVERG
ncbi:N-acetyltransferase [Streptomyces ipomoeae]|jgi:RimJ/RimL family protein N-acetyltransferase|uniref:Acetyltransferase, GNAT family n=2 Tax=Streptomyces ipomoeae TaxID=103232 RepID=L1L0A9_9ACTN|nr:GNAT family protein [Streptomyces ipomoeae]EKX66229.1 acetyltransferase, GNAT family [Streptomyces ipomoeae 91-03]MDX2697636.1 GNAT family protein [Streptomyces ipomoeae]MDX2825142.1 GNAT family protein [Streptomyces ipomoeae]MDX2842273.1 GNAT family protein [Streptomyces ipomoeae]MDX2876702.1 GNAT family protein [Streptomyces ipomoeae]